MTRLCEQKACSPCIIHQLVFLFIFVQIFFMNIVAVQQCLKADKERLKFQLIKQCKRSNQKFITLENTLSLEECISLGIENRGLALNYAPLARRSEQRFHQKMYHNSNNKTFLLPQNNNVHFLDEPERYFNCHILECPENSTFRTMINDSRFDYFSLYAPPISKNYSCLPGIGLVQLELQPLSFLNASIACRNSSMYKGSLAHIASERRTREISAHLGSYNEKNRKNQQNHLSLAYVGLHLNRSYTHEKDFRTSENESLSCYRFRAWSPGYPQRVDYKVSNTSCVAITLDESWRPIDCERKLPYFCDIYTLDPQFDDDYEIGITDADQCIPYRN